MPKFDLTRRGFLYGFGAVVGGCALGGVAYASEPETDFLRPPGASAQALHSKCIRCDRCMNICPEGIIYPLGIESGLINVYTPALDFEHGKCTFCNKCVDVCPTAIIAGVDPADTASGRIGVAEVLPERCLAYVASGSCGVCADACEYGALYLNDEHRPVVIEEKCNGCGACFVKCPANVLTSFSGGKERGINVVVES